MRASKGQILVLVVIGMVAILLVAGLAVDVGVWYKDQRTIEHAAELAALRGYQAICEQGGVFDITDPADPVRVAIENTLKVNGVSASEIASATISASKSGVVTVTLSRKSPSLFTRVGGHTFAPVAGFGDFETNRLAPFAIPEQYNDEDRDQRPNYDPTDPGELITPPYTDPSFDNCSYIPGSPYIILYSIETAQTTHDWVFIPMDDTAAKIPIGRGAFGCLGSFECPYSSLPLGSKEGSGHLPYYDGASVHETPGGVYDQADLLNGSAQHAYYLLWQKTFDLATNMNLIYQIPLFRAYGIMWDVLGAPPTDGQYPFIAWFRGLHGGAFAVQRRHLEAAGFKIVRCPAEVNDPGGNAFNTNDYVRIERVTDDTSFSPVPPARRAGDTGVRALLLRFGPYGQTDKYGQPLDYPPGNEDEYIRHVMRSVAFVRWYNELNEDGRIKSIEFGRSTTSDATRIQPRIATYTGTTDPVTRVLSWSGIPFDACFGEYNPRISLDPNTTCLNSFCLRDEISAAGGTMSNAADILSYLRTHVPGAPAGKPKRGYHWLHVHHENFAQDIETDPDVRAMALAIRNFVADGGFLFDACLGAETLEAALAYLEKETPPNLIEAHGEYSALTQTLAHDHFHIKKSATGKLRICLDSAGTEADLANGLPATTGMSTIYGYFSLVDPKNSRSCNHTGFAAGCEVVDYEDPTGLGPLRTITPAEATAEAIRFYGGSYMGFDATLLKNDETPGVTVGVESGTTLEDRANVLGHDVVYKLGTFDRSWDGSVDKTAKPNGLVYLSGTVTGPSAQGQYALIGGHLPHHDPYTVLTREYFVEGAWYHRTSTHISWKWNKVFKGDPKDRGDGLTYDSEVPVATPTPCTEEAVIAWRGGLARNRYYFYTDGSWNWNEPWTWTGTWGEYTGGHWDPAAHWDPAPTWTDSDGWLGWQSNAGWEWDSEEGYLWVGAWLPGHWVGGTWVPGNWVADWWETTSTWTWAGYWSWDGWSYYPNSDLRQRFGRNTAGATQLQCEAYLEVLGDLMFLHSNWWSCVPAGDCDLADGHRGPGRLPLTLANNDGVTTGDVLAFKGNVSMSSADHIGNRMDPTNQRYPSLDARLAGQWGSCWPTIYDLPDNHVEISTNTIEEFYNNTWNVGAGLEHNCLRLSDSDATTLSDTNLVGANNSWQAVKSTNVAGGHRPENNSQWDAFRFQLGALDMDNSRTYEMYRAVTYGISLTNRSGGHNRFVWDRQSYFRYFLGLPRWNQFQILLDEWDNVMADPNIHAPSSFLPNMESHGLDMCVRDVDNNGVTGDIYEGGAIYRGVPDVAFHRLYLNNILLGALSAEIPNFGAGGMNCGAVNWGGMGAGSFASGASPFNVNSFLDIMRLGVKGGGLRVGDTFWTSPGDFKEAVRNGTEYMFTDTATTRVKVTDDPLNATTVTWSEYVNNLAPERYYRYKMLPGRHLYNSAGVLDGIEIKKEGLEFLNRPPQIMTMACVERTDGNDKSIYFTPHGAPASSIEVKVIGFARFFLIDKEIDDLTYNATTGDHSPALVPKDPGFPTRETLFLGPDPTLPGELRGHFLGWEIKPPNP